MERPDIPTRIRSQFTRGSTSVVGVLLLIGITIVLGAVFVTIGLSYSEDVDDSAPVANFEYEYNDKNNQVKVVLKTGDSLNGNRIRFDGAATEKTQFGSIPRWAGKKVTAGDTATVGVKSDETLRIVWKGNGSKQTAILGNYDVPVDPPATASIGTVDTDYTANDGSVCLSNIQFSNAYGGNVYIVAKGKTKPSLRDSIVVPENGSDVKLSGLNPGNSFGNGEDLIVTVYETQSKNNQLYRVTSEAKNKNGSCTI